MNIYVTFIGRSVDEGDTSEAIVNEEVLLSTIDENNFETGVNGFPVYDLTVTAAQFSNVTNNTAQSIASTDVFTTRFELILTDGRIFSSDNTAVDGGLNSDFFINTFVD